jgi:hypothetical protein
MAGSDGGNFVAGIHSCHADTACLSAGRDGSFEVGHDSCNVAYACEYAGQIGDGPSSVGNFSCNYSDNVYNTECAGDVSGSRPDVGDCMYNDPSPLQVIILRALGCALFGPLDQTELDVLWQAILAIFVFD